MKHIRSRRIISWFLLIALLTGSAGSSKSFAAPPILQPPQGNNVADIGYIENANSDDWYAALNWEPMSYPTEAHEKYINLGLSEAEYGSGKLLLDVLQVALGGNETNYQITEYSPEGIKHGTIYEAYLKASYKTEPSMGQYTVTSQRSNPAKFLTGMHVSLELVPGTNNIKIKWDDVWDTTGRINYRILISDTAGFTQPPPIPDIMASEIDKSGSAVTINRDEKKLEYIYTSAHPGREYSIKVVPLPNSDVACASSLEIEAVKIKTDIILKAQRVGYTNEGDVIWKLFWNPIVKGSTYTHVDYKLYRYTGDNPEGLLFRLIPDLDNYQFIVKEDDPVYSFKVDAEVYELGKVDPIVFGSNNKIVLKEQVPQQPEAPDIVDAFLDADPPLNYEELSTSSGATVLWRVPYNGDGSIDNDVTYDIYLLEDIKDVSNPPSNYRIAYDITMGEANKVFNAAGEIIGYRYNLGGLKSNSTYYFAVYAKKNFLVQNPQDGFMITTPYVSKQAVKVIITKPDTGTDRPIAPASPPFGLKPGADSVTFTGATLMMEKKWVALFDRSNKRWDSVSYDDYIKNQLLDPDDAAKRIGMVINYPTGWTVVPHIVDYNDALNVIRMRNNGRENVTYSDLSQPDIKAFEISQQSVTIPDIADDDNQSFTFDVTGLEHNRTYLAWVTIENQNGTTSDPSDAVIISTPPQIPEIPVTPTVPNDLKGIAAENFVDLFWTFTKDMNYEIKGGTSDTLDSASITQQVSYEDIQRNTYSRVENLEPDTIYYFWIKTISEGTQNQPLESVYSNPLIIRTEANKPPAPPTGFGVKSGADGVTEKTVTYLWDAKIGFTYFLEFADNANFDKATLVNVTSGTYTVNNLIANRRYYARIYAFETETQLRSEPTRAIMVITNKSKGEYDGSFDLDEAVSGDGLVVPVKLENGVWTITSLGANAHVLGERIRAQYGPVVQIDLSQPPAKTTTVRLDLGANVIEVLSELKKELYVKLPWGQFLIRPGTFQTDDYFKQKEKDNNLSFRLEAISPASSYKPSSFMQIKTPVTDLKVSYLNGNYFINKLTRPIRVELPVVSLTSFAQGQIKTYGYNTTQSWYALPTFSDYTNGQVVGELDKPGAIVAATWGVQPAPSVPAYITKSLEQIQSVFDLKSFERKSFNQGASITQKDLLKLILDVVPTDYTDSNITQKALRSGLIQSTSDVTNAYARRDKAVGILISLYKFKTRESAVPTKPSVWSRYQDLSKVDKHYLDAYKFALENGIIQGNGSTLAYPDKIMTYGDFLVMLERTLRLCGEI